MSNEERFSTLSHRRKRIGARSDLRVLLPTESQRVQARIDRAAQPTVWRTCAFAKPTCRLVQRDRAGSVLTHLGDTLAMTYAPESSAINRSCCACPPRLTRIALRITNCQPRSSSGENGDSCVTRSATRFDRVSWHPWMDRPSLGAQAGQDRAKSSLSGGCTAAVLGEDFKGDADRGAKRLERYDRSFAVLRCTWTCVGEDQLIAGDPSLKQ